MAEHKGFESKLSINKPITLAKRPKPIKLEYADALTVVGGNKQLIPEVMKIGASLREFNRCMVSGDASSAESVFMGSMKQQLVDFMIANGVEVLTYERTLGMINQYFEVARATATTDTQRLLLKTQQNSFIHTLGADSMPALATNFNIYAKKSELEVIVLRELANSMQKIWYDTFTQQQQAKMKQENLTLDISRPKPIDINSNIDKQWIEDHTTLDTATNERSSNNSRLQKKVGPEGGEAWTIDIYTPLNSELPPSFQEQNILASKVVTNLINSEILSKVRDTDSEARAKFIESLITTKAELKAGVQLTDPFFVDLSQKVHEQYMSRNPWALNTELDVHFNDLTPVEQEKDTNQIMLGISQLIESQL
jgi:hypothetical protein